MSIVLEDLYAEADVVVTSSPERNGKRAVGAARLLAAACICEALRAASLPANRESIQALQLEEATGLSVDRILKVLQASDEERVTLADLVAIISATGCELTFDVTRKRSAGRNRHLLDRDL
jgi:hypothetical protein